MEDRAPLPRRKRARWLAAVPALALLGLAAGAAPAVADTAPPPGINLDVLGLIQIHIPVTIGGADGNTVGTGVALNVPGVTSLAAPVNADFGAGAFLHLPLSVNLQLPLLYSLNLPVPPIVLNGQHLLGGLPIRLSLLATSLTSPQQGALNLDAVLDLL